MDEKTNPRRGNLLTGKRVMIKTVMNVSQRLTQTECAIGKNIRLAKTVITLP